MGVSDGCGKAPMNRKLVGATTLEEWNHLPQLVDLQAKRKGQYRVFWMLLILFYHRGSNGEGFWKQPCNIVCELLASPQTCTYMDLILISLHRGARLAIKCCTHSIDTQMASKALSWALSLETRSPTHSVTH